MTNEYGICFQFTMPLNETLKIISSKPIDEFEIAIDQEVEGIEYLILWNDELLPYGMKTRLQALSVALGCQWGASETFKRMNKNGKTT